MCSLWHSFELLALEINQDKRIILNLFDDSAPTYRVIQLLSVQNIRHMSNLLHCFRLVLSTAVLRLCYRRLNSKAGEMGPRLG